mmetsp:Transcript_5230/g.13004  ORF Transcript_5230/g.13004 Transcript_5230/m.13004 type:complete len:1219 (-) Transcript_5230:59-3715(-)
MLVKCETKSNRIKGLSFHPKLSWILASLHNGTIQLWDYRTGSLIDKFEEHEGGPVRGVCFHSSQPLFVSGGDDYKIKIWNYKLRRCIFTLLGHLDYIRTVEFHDEYPWIVSASDDQTIRIWNWQSRSCIAVLTGHNHYVMCAHFHPKEDLVVSASLDQSVRVWDTSGLRDKTVSISGGAPPTQGSSDVFGTTDAVVKYVLEGHERGVNWAAFHPTLPLIASGADDRLIKLWRMNDSKAWEVDTLRGHFNNVSCVLFHPKKELIISNSEDRTIRVWDVTKRTGIHTFRRENDRFWIITAHRTSNLIAVGHDAGMVVFKLDCERPLAMCNGSQLYIVQDRELQSMDLDRTLKGSQISSCRRPPNAMASGMKSLQFNTYNPTRMNVLVFYTLDSGCYDLFVGSGEGSEMSSSPMQGAASAVAFTARDRFAVLHLNGSIGIYNLQNELSKKIDPPTSNTIEYIYPGGNNRLLLKSEEKVVLYDITARKVIADICVAGGVRYVVWSPSGQYVAFMSKHNVLLAGKNLEYLHSFHENIRVKSAAWDENGVLVYSTLSHVKYCLTNGDSGIIHSLANPIYIVRAHRQHLYWVDREHTVNKERLNCTEYLFKLSLQQRKFNDVKMWIKNGKLCGNVVIGYLKQKGYPEVALHFVEDQQTRFNLALEYGHIEEAMVAAQEINDTSCWNRLGLEALRQGNQQIVERVYQKTSNFDALSFLYLITGNHDKLGKMLWIAQQRQDVMSRFNNALMLGNVEERVKIMAEMGQVPLALLTAKAHNMTEFIPKLEEQMQGNDVSSHIPANARLLLPPAALIRPSAGDAGNWPLLQSVKSIFERGSIENLPAPEELPFQDAMDEAPEDTELGGTFGFDEDLNPGVSGAGGAWGDDMDIDFGGEDFKVFEEVPVEEKSHNVTMADTPQTKWLRKRKLVADLVAAGEFEEALNLLRRRLGLINADPLEPLFRQAFWATCSALPSLPQGPSLTLPILSEGNFKSRELSPLTLFTFAGVIEQVKEGYRAFTQGKFPEAMEIFRTIVQSIPLGVAKDAEEESNYNETIGICREYITATRIEVARKSLDPSQVARNLELASYLTCCKLQPQHLMLTLRVAMSVSVKAQNFVTAASFAKRLVQGSFGNAPQTQEVVAQARKVLQLSESKGTDANAINFDPRAPIEDMKVCAGSLTPIVSTDTIAQCPYCNSSYKSSYKGKLCDTCQLAEIGANTLGIQLRPI